MTEAELIAKQQLEIETLRIRISEIRDVCNVARMPLIYAEQWSITAEDFPKVAMRAIVSARSTLEGL